jgi:hypothetical protein
MEYRAIRDRAMEKLDALPESAPKTRRDNLSALVAIADFQARKADEFETGDPDPSEPPPESKV